MKGLPPRAGLLVQTDLFEEAPAPAPLASLQLHRVEIVELLSQLLWQVAAAPGTARQPEDDDEQDQP